MWAVMVERILYSIVLRGQRHVSYALVRRTIIGNVLKRPLWSMWLVSEAMCMWMHVRCTPSHKAIVLVVVGILDACSR